MRTYKKKEEISTKKEYILQKNKENGKNYTFRRIQQTTNKKNPRSLLSHRHKTIATKNIIMLYSQKFDKKYKRNLQNL